MCVYISPIHIKIAVYLYHKNKIIYSQDATSVVVCESSLPASGPGLVLGSRSRVVLLVCRGRGAGGGGDVVLGRG